MCQQFQYQLAMQRSLTQCQIIPNRIILRNNNYAQRKIIINKKFEWLSKYISATSPKIFNPNKFTTSTKIPSQIKRTKSRMSQNRLKTCYDQVCANQLSEKNVLANKSQNHRELRKTTSHQFNGQAKKNQPSSECSIARFFRCKKTKTQFSKSKRQQTQSQTHRHYIEDSQIKPWNFQINKDDEYSCFKENQSPVRK